MSSSIRRNPVGAVQPAPSGGTLADVLDRVLDKGIVIAGDVQINLLNIELLTIRIRLLIASVDKAREIGINWWSDDSYYSRPAINDGTSERMLEDRCQQLEDEVKRLSERLEPSRSTPRKRQPKAKAKRAATKRSSHS